MAAAVALAKTAGSMPPKPGSPKPARLANKFMFDRFPKLPIDPIGSPANGISNGFVLGSNWPKLDRPDSNDVFKLASPELASDGKDMLDGSDVVTLAELTLDVDPVGLESSGGRPELLDFGLLLPDNPLMFDTAK